MENGTRITIIFGITLNSIPIVNLLNIINRISRLSPLIITETNFAIRSDIFINLLILLVFLFLIVLFIQLKERLNKINQEFFDFTKILALFDVFFLSLYFTMFILTPTHPSLDEFNFAFIIGIVAAFLVVLGLMNLFYYKKIKSKAI
ncbi:MAG: hypothetical protein ACXACX_01655 [Candidatus Hodarchaeales archaeon]|jgi:hypothetical protein